MKPLRYLFIAMICLMLGCERNVIDKLGMLDAIGYDLSEDQELPLMVTANYPNVTKQGVYQNKILTVNAKSSKDSRIRLNHRSNLKLVSGQITVALFGSELAKVGVQDIIDTYMRDPSLGPRVYFAVTEGPAKEILDFKPIEGTNSSLYLRTFIEKLDDENERINYNTYQFIRDYYDDGIDPIMPYYKLRSDNISLDGYALFKDDRFVHHLSPTLSGILFTLRKNTPRGTFSFEIAPPDDTHVFSNQLMFDYVKKDWDIDIAFNNHIPKTVKISIELNGSMLEYTNDELTDSKKTQMKLEKKINAYMEKKSEEFLELTQQLKVDPVGIGGYVRNKLSYEDWNHLNWEEVYPEIDFDVTIQMKFVNTGQTK
ncbi:Ger(x)C family spore germination protein [Bacillus sp. KH172YL63]|uniref:Ger(x)C family spore germination protein n=1 Tax=Bacillus sp. KH172YL63 TaxID=2709784 RepID=UPI0013E5241E|nr:Ger(x)C family spore germination protein [Bacillus sp. KH172YL63]BCB04646.1 germination protein GerYC [Bacillus sp. KH172YL63]